LYVGTAAESLMWHSHHHCISEATVGIKQRIIYL